MALVWSFAIVSQVAAQVGDKPGGVVGASKSNDPAIDVSIELPTDAHPGSIRVSAPKGVVLDRLRGCLPKSAPLPDQNLGNVAIYRDVALKKLTLSILKKTKLGFEGQSLSVAAVPRIAGEIDLKYEHVTITTEVRTVATIFGREIKSSVPVVHREWRARAPIPFSLDVDVTGRVTPSIDAGKSLNDLRLQLAVATDRVRIARLDLQADDPLLALAAQIVGTVGKAIANEGFNKAIKDQFARTFSIDPFRQMTNNQRDGLAKSKASEVSLKIDERNVVIAAKLTK
jgi:hypothetical protein